MATETPYKIKPSGWVALIALVIGGGLGYGLAVVWPGGPWWIYALVGLLLAGAAYAKLIELVAYQKISDRDSD